jgi:hypothetical protein
MKIIIKLSIQIMLLLTFSNTIGQINPFTAGSMNDSTTFFTFIPNETLTVKEGSTNYSIDMNNDGIFDFTFLVAHLDELAGNAGFRCYIRLKPKQENLIAFSHYYLSEDPYGWGNDSIYTPVPKVNNFGDTINNNLDFKDTTLTLYESSYQMESFVIDINDWFGENEKYIAVCISEPENDTYGWIKVSSIHCASITIEAYGLNKFPSSIENIMVQEKIIIAPNPANNYINIIPKSHHIGFVTFELIDCTGKMIESKRIDLSNSFRFNLKNEWKGVYFLKLKSDNYNFTKKLIIK